jgi:hypothetical protein
MQDILSVESDLIDEYVRGESRDITASVLKNIFWLPRKTP